VESPQQIPQDSAPVSPPVMIHVRFSPDGSVVEIGERPADLDPQAWFNRLSDKAGTGYQPLSGGRGLFRLSRADVDALKAASVN
jgi:hypothetical protein